MILNELLFEAESYFFISLLLIAGIIFILISLHVTVKGEKYVAYKKFVLLMLNCSAWCITYVLQLVTPTYTGALFFYYLKFSTIALIPVSLFSFILRYTGRSEWLTKPRLLSMLAPPLFHILAIWSNQVHGFFWSDITYERSINVNFISGTPGFLFWSHTIYSYLLIVTAMFLIFDLIINQRRIHQKELLGLLLSITPPFIVNMLMVIPPLADMFVFDLTPVLFLVPGFFFTWLMIKGDLLRIQPIALSRVFDKINDAIFILDQKNRIVDFNKKGDDLLQKNNLLTSETCCENILTLSPGLQNFFRNIDYSAENKNLVEIKEKNSEKYYKTEYIPVFEDQNRHIGGLLIMRDLTDWVQTENRLKQKIDELEQFRQKVVDRELRMTELKKQLESYKSKTEKEEDKLLTRS